MYSSIYPNLFSIKLPCCTLAVRGVEVDLLVRVHHLVHLRKEPAKDAAEERDFAARLRRLVQHNRSGVPEDGVPEQHVEPNAAAPLKLRFLRHHERALRRPALVLARQRLEPRIARTRCLQRERRAAELCKDGDEDRGPRESTSVPPAQERERERERARVRGGGGAEGNSGERSSSGME